MAGRHYARAAGSRRGQPRSYRTQMRFLPTRRRGVEEHRWAMKRYILRRSFREDTLQRIGIIVCALLTALFGLAPCLLAGEITFHQQVLPVLQKHCMSCHRPGEAAPMSLLTYKDARPWAKAIQRSRAD
jgi:hypothetical protein